MSLDNTPRLDREHSAQLVDWDRPTRPPADPRWANTSWLRFPAALAGEGTPSRVLTQPVPLAPVVLMLPTLLGPMRMTMLASDAPREPSR